VCIFGGFGPSSLVLAWPIMHRAPNGEIDEDAQNAKRTLGPPNGQYGDGRPAGYPMYDAICWFPTIMAKQAVWRSYRWVVAQIRVFR